VDIGQSASKTRTNLDLGHHKTTKDMLQRKNRRTTILEGRMQATVEAVEDEGDLGVHEGNIAVWANGGSWEWEEKQRFWEKEEQGCVREEKKSESLERRKRRRFIAGERQTHPARDGVNSANAASCPSLANLTGCLLPLRSKRADTNCKPRVANREDSSGLQTTEVHTVMMETEPGDPTAANIEEEVFGRTRGYLTERRPIDYRRDIDHDTPDRVIDKWF